MTSRELSVIRVSPTPSELDEPEWKHESDEELAVRIMVNFVRNVARGYRIDSLRLSRLAYLQLGKELEVSEKRVDVEAT